MLADLLVQPFAFGAEHQHGAAVEGLLKVVPAAFAAGQAVDPGSGLLELFQGPGQVHHPHQRHPPGGAGAGPDDGLVDLGRPAFGVDHAVHPGAGGGAEDGAEIVRVADAVQGQHQGLVAALPDPRQERVHATQGDGLALAQDALVAGALAAPVEAVHGLAVDHDALFPGGGAQLGLAVPGGGGDAQGHERGREYDTMSGLYAEFIENEVLPLVEKNYGVKLTKDPEGRATMGGSSGGSAALIMAWYHPELYHRVLTFSGTFVNQQWPFNPETPDGAWDFHTKLIPESAPKPIRIWMAVGDRDNFNPNVMRDGMHDWVEANNRMATVLKAKGYHYQYLYCLNCGHGVGNAKPQILPEALEWLWHGYPVGKTP